VNKFDPLSKAVNYSTQRVNKSGVLLENYVTTESLLPDKEGVGPSTKLPTQDGNINKYSRGNILVSNIRPYLKKIWYADKEGGCSSDVLVFSVKEEYNSKFVYYAMLSDDFFEHMMRGSKGTKMPRGDKTQILEFKIPRVDLPIQGKIAEALSVLDTKIDLNNKINEQLESMAKLLYEYWFINFEFPMSIDQAASIGKLHLVGHPYQSSGGKMTYNETLKREIPVGWSSTTLGKILRLYQPKTIAEKDLKSDGDFFVYGANGIVGKYDKFNHEEPQVALTCRGSCGKLNRTMPFSWITGNAMVLAPREIKLNIEYIYNLAKFSGINSIITGSVQPQITRANLQDVKTISPDPNVVAAYQELTDSICKKRVNLELQNQKISSLRNWLLPFLMSGQITVK